VIITLTPGLTSICRKWSMSDLVSTFDPSFVDFIGVE
jgi:hypothetical protein